MNTITNMHKQIHSFENNEKLLDYKLEYKDIPMWPLIREGIMISCIDKREGLVNERREYANAPKHRLQELIIRNPFLTLPKKVIYAGFPNYIMIPHEDGLVYDERTMPYIEMTPNASMLMSITEEKKFKYAYHHWKTDYVIKALAKRKEFVSKRDSVVAHQFIQYMREEFPLPLYNSQIKSMLDAIMSYSKFLRGYTETWKLYLKIVKPQLIIQCCGSYLAIDQVALKLACNELHILTAEIQHAYEGVNSHAHYWGEQIVKSDDCKKIFPDYFLTYGGYWNNAVSLPSKKVVIGTHRKYQLNMGKRNDNILICVSTNYSEYVNLLECIIRNVQTENKIYLRLHPAENTKRNRSLFMPFIRSGRVEFANGNRLEYYLGKCTYVVSCGSTVIYEALTCGNIVFVPKDKMYDLYNLESINDRIYSFQTLEEFEILWGKRHAIEMRSYNDFYDMNYRKLYGDFLRKLFSKNKNFHNGAYNKKGVY